MATVEPQGTVRWDLDWEDAADLPASAPAPPPATVAVPPPLPPPLPVAPPPPPVAVVSPPLPPPVPTARVLVRGQRVQLAELSSMPGLLEVALTLVTPPGLTLDLACFGLDAAGRLSDDRYFIFYNQKSSPEGAVRAEGEVFRVDLARLPASVRRLAFAATVDGPGTVRALGGCACEIRGTNGVPFARYPFSGSELDEVAALIVLEIYAKEAADWRVAAVTQGFAGGLPALLRHFGGEEH